MWHRLIHCTCEEWYTIAHNDYSPLYHPFNLSTPITCDGGFHCFALISDGTCAIAEEHLSCLFSLDVCNEILTVVQYLDTDGITHRATVIDRTGSLYTVDSNETCYYNLDNFVDVEWCVDYHPARWALSFICTIVIGIVLCIFLPTWCSATPDHETCLIGVHIPRRPEPYN